MVPSGNTSPCCHVLHTTCESRHPGTIPATQGYLPPLDDTALVLTHELNFLQKPKPDTLEKSNVYGQRNKQTKKGHVSHNIRTS